MKPLSPNYQSGDDLDCTVDPTPPAIDTIFVALHVAGVAYLASKSNEQNKDQVNSLIATNLGGLIMWGSSAIYGYRRISACSDARNDAGESYSHHLGVQHRAYRPLPPGALPFAGPPPDAAPAGAAPAPDVAPIVTPQQTPAPQRRDDERPTTHSAPASKPWTLPQED